jgi:hypothetical protein
VGEEPAIIGLDSCCSRHLFTEKSDFINGIKPIDPVEIMGVSGDLILKGTGSVRVRFRDDNGAWVDKIIDHAYYAPDSPVRLISITQLARDFKKQTGKKTSLCTESDSSLFIWGDDVKTVLHPPPASVPFLEAFPGNPPENYSRWHKEVCSAFLADMPCRRAHMDDCCLIPVEQEKELEQESAQPKRVNFSAEVEFRAQDASI